MEVVKHSRKAMTMNSSRKYLPYNTDKKEGKPGVTLFVCGAGRAPLFSLERQSFKEVKNERE